MGKKKGRKIYGIYWKHADEYMYHRSMVDLLLEIQDVYVNSNTRIEIWAKDQVGVRRIMGPV